MTGPAPARTRRAWTAGIASAAAVIGLVTLVSRVVGFGRWVVQAATVGRGCVGDVYSATNQIPNVAYEVVIGGALAAAVVPVLSPMLARPSAVAAAEPGNDDARRTVSALLTWAVLISAPISLGLAALAGPLGRAVAPSSCPGGAGLSTYLLLVFSPQVLLYAVGAVAAGALQARRRFLAAAVAPLLSSLVVIGAYLAVGATIDGHRNAIAGLPAASRAWLGWGTTAGVVALSLPLLLPVASAYAGLRPTLSFPPGVASAVRAQALGGLAALLAQQVFVVAVLALTRRPGAPVGAINVFQYAQAVYLLPFAVLVVAVTTSAFPELSAARNVPDRFAATSARALRACVAMALLGMVVLLATAPAVEAFFGVLEGSGRGVAGMAGALGVMTPGLVGLAVLTQASRTLQAAGLAARAARGVATGWLVAGLAAVAGVVLAGSAHTLVAVSVGSTLGMTAGAVVLFADVRAVCGPAAVAGVSGLVATGLPASALLAGLGWWGTQQWLSTASQITAGLAVLVGLVMGAGTALTAAAVVVAREPSARSRLLRRRA